MQVHFFRPSTGERRVYETDGMWREEENQFNPFIWEEGNFSCDCNRSIFMYDSDETKELPCSGHEIIIEKIVAKDEPEIVLYSEPIP